jgi:outer membrane protein insertion porin family
MHQQIIRYSLFALLIVIGFACRQAKYVTEGNYLHKKNTIYFEVAGEDSALVMEKEQEGIYAGEMQDMIKPVPNKRFKLFVYNRINQERYQTKKALKDTAVVIENRERKEKEDTINYIRIEKAKAKGKDYYKHKTKRMKPKKSGWRDWVLSHMGQAPVLYDSAQVEKSRTQLTIYLKKRGYYDATVRDSVYFKEKKQKSYAEYYVNAGQPYIIDSFALDASADANMRNMYRKFVKAEKSVIVLGAPIDEDVLELERENFSKYCRDEGAYFGFVKSYITFEVDTLGKGHAADVYMHFIPKSVPHPTIKDSMILIPHQTYYVKNMTFLLHNTDTNSFKFGYHNFKKRCDSLNLNYLASAGKYNLLDTLVNIDTLYRRGVIDSIYYKGVYIYNDVPYLNPDLIDRQNFLYRPHYAKEYYLERTYRTMLQLDVFSTITPIVEVDPSNPFGNKVNVTYHLVPSKKQTFTLEPRVTTSNSVLGLMGSVSYVNKNLFRGAQKLKISFIGGFESQPLIINESGAESQIRKLNTFEWGPTIQLTFPKLVPMPRSIWERMSKRAYPSTKFDLAVNFQRRQEFSRRLAHFAYAWNFKISKDQGKMDEIGLQFVNFNFVRLFKTDDFAAKLDSLNDPFILNSYADHFSLYNGIFYKTDNQVPNEYNKVISIFQFTFLQSGGLLNVTGIGAGSLSDPDSLKQIFGVPFTQFVRIDAQHLFQYKFANKKHKIATRILAGVGYAYGNSPSLPYEQSFYGGGSNDIRAFAARTMAPGSIRIYEDTTATLTQIGDMRLELNLEYRFRINDLLEGALFVDMGNIWKLQDDPNTTKDNLGVFGFGTFYKQVAIGTGFGLRADFDFLIVRLDLAFPLHNPYLPEGEKWFGTPHPIYISNWDAGANGNNNGFIDPIHVDKNGTITSGDTNGNGAIDIYDEANRYFSPFQLRFNVGIGYPF